jgi:putative membrane protein
MKINATPSSPSRSFRALALLAATLATGITALPILAQDMGPTPTPTQDSSPTPTPMMDNSTLPHGDKVFLMKAAKGSNNEVALSQLAADRASNPDVKSFALQMIAAHQQLDRDIETLASQKNVDISKAIEKGQKEDVDSLSKDMGADFDKAYVKKMIAGHEDASAVFEKESTEGKDADVVALANKYLSVVNSHLEHAKMIKKEVE